MSKGRAPALTKCTSTNKTIIADHYYECEIAAKKSGLPIEFLKTFSQCRSEIIPYTRFNNKVYFDKYIIDDMAEQKRFFPAKKSIAFAYENFLEKQIENMSYDEHSYAITITFRAKGYNYTSISAKCILSTALLKVSRQIYKNAFNKRNCAIGAIGIIEKPDTYPHFHGVISLPEKIKNLKNHPNEKALLEKLIASSVQLEIENKSMWRVEAKPSVVVAKLHDPHGWAWYLQKETKSISMLREEDSFESLIGRYIF